MYNCLCEYAAIVFNTGVHMLELVAKPIIHLHVPTYIFAYTDHYKVK